MSNYSSYSESCSSLVGQLKQDPSSWTPCLGNFYCYWSFCHAIKNSFICNFLNSFSCLCVHIHVCMCVCRNIWGGHMHKWHVCRGHPQKCHLHSLRWGSLSWRSPIRQDWLPISSSPALGFQVRSTVLTIFMWVAGIELWFLYLHNKYFNDRAVSPAFVHSINVFSANLPVVSLFLEGEWLTCLLPFSPYHIPGNQPSLLEWIGGRNQWSQAKAFENEFQNQTPTC